MNRIYKCIYYASCTQAKNMFQDILILTIAKYLWWSYIKLQKIIWGEGKVTNVKEYLERNGY